MEEFIGYTIALIFLVVRGFMWFRKQKKKKPTLFPSNVEVEETDPEMDEYELEEEPLNKTSTPPPLPIKVNIPKPARKHQSSLQQYMVFHEILKKPKSLEE